MKKPALKGSYEDFLNNDFADKEFHFRLLNPRLNSSLRDTYGRSIIFPVSSRIEAFAIINEKDQNGRIVNKTIRYIPGETSIYKDQQSDDKLVPKKKYFIEFVRGRKVIMGTDSALLEFMMKSNLNASNPARKTDVQPKFELVDTAKVVGDLIKEDKLKSEAAHFCYSGDVEDVVAYARVLGVNINNRVDEIRYDLKVIADRNPGLFLDNLKNPKMKTKHYVLTAIDRGFLVVRPENNSIAWATNIHQPISIAPAGRDIVDYFVHNLSTTEGKLVLEAIIDMVRPVDKTEQPKMVVPSKEELANLKSAIEPANPMLKAAIDSDKELMELVDAAEKLKVITFKAPTWWRFRDKNYRSKDELVAKLKGDSEMLAMLRHDIRTA